MEYKSETKKCQNCKREFVIEQEDFNFYEKIKVPPPTFCPECRFQRRIQFRNERILYKRTCLLCKKNIITIYNPENTLPVYCNECWYGDKWDALKYGKDYDFSRSFFDQLKELWQVVPQLAVNSIQNTNSTYVNFAAQNKNSYLLSGALYNEDCAYGTRILNSKNSLDSYNIDRCTLCYEAIHTLNSYNSSHILNCESVVDAISCRDCKGVTSAIGCVNLCNVNNFVFNQKLSPVAYAEYIKNFNQGSFSFLQQFLEKFKEFSLGFPRRFAQVVQSKNSEGDQIFHSKNVHHSFFVNECEDIKYAIFMKKVKFAMDIYADDESELGYETMSGQNAASYLFDIQPWYSQNIRYSVLVQSSHDLFACIGLRSKQYCILNKQYTKEEYEELVPKIIQHMNDMPYIDKKGRIYKYGEFFPPELSPFCYNETIAQEYFPLTKEEALEQGYKWKDREERNYTIDIKNKDIPNDIKEVKDEITGKVIECEHKGTCNEQCTEAFKIIPDELSFYKRMNLPIPHLCPNCRHYNRLKQRNPLKLWHRKCMKKNCTNEFETSYAPERPEIVYCEKCYQQEVY